jgi:hypothetical protein
VARTLDLRDLDRRGWRRAVVRRAGGRRCVSEVDVVDVRIDAVGAAGEAVRPCGVVFEPGARSFGVGSARVAFVAQRVNERRAVAKADRVRATVLDGVRRRSVNEVAVDDCRRVGADDEVVARWHRHIRQVDRVVDQRPASVSIDELHDVRVEVDRRCADVLELEKLRGVGRHLVVVDLVDHHRGRRRLRSRGTSADTTAPSVSKAARRARCIFGSPP